MKKFLLTAGGVLGAIAIALLVMVLTFNLDAHRDQLTAVLAKETGRAITLKGPLKLALTGDGVVLSVQDADIGNPPGSGGDRQIQSRRRPAAATES